jgi:hypothetical protein
MGIAALVSTGRLEVLKRMSSEIFNLWLDVFGEIKESTENEPTYDGRCVLCTSHCSCYGPNVTPVAHPFRRRIISDGIGSMMKHPMNGIKEVKANLNTIAEKR